MRTLEYNKTKTTALYSKHKILEIPDIFQLSVAKFMYWCYNGGLPIITLTTTFLRLHQSTNIKQDLPLCKNIIYPEWKQLWVSFLWSILVRKFGLTFWKDWNRLRLIHLAKNIKKSCYLARLPVDLRFICLSHSVWSLFYILVTFWNIVWCHYFPSYLPL